MSEIKDREEFVKRTREILEKKYAYFKKDEDREVTFLLNCLLGTIVAVSESKKSNLKGNIDDKFLELFPDKIGFLKKKSEEYYLSDTEKSSIDFEVGHRTDLKIMPKRWLLKKIRNGIAHLNIEWENDGGKCKTIRLWNEAASKVKDFEITFEIEQLKDFAIELSKKYLSEKNPQEAE